MMQLLACHFGTVIVADCRFGTCRFDAAVLAAAILADICHLAYAIRPGGGVSHTLTIRFANYG